MEDTEDLLHQVDLEATAAGTADRQEEEGEGDTGETKPRFSFS